MAATEVYLAGFIFCGTLDVVLVAALVYRRRSDSARVRDGAPALLQPACAAPDSPFDDISILRIGCTEHNEWGVENCGAFGAYGGGLPRRHAQYRSISDIASPRPAPRPPAPGPPRPLSVQLTGSSLSVSTQSPDSVASTQSVLTAARALATPRPLSTQAAAPHAPTHVRTRPLSAQEHRGRAYLRWYPQACGYGGAGAGMSDGAQSPRSLYAECRANVRVGIFRRTSATDPFRPGPVDAAHLAPATATPARTDYSAASSSDELSLAEYEAYLTAQETL